jgi:hypothetical protein
MAGGGSAHLEVSPLAIPVQRERRQQFLSREVSRVLTLQDRLGDLRRQAGQAHHPAQVGRVDGFGYRQGITECVTHTGTNLSSYGSSEVTVWRWDRD